MELEALVGEKRRDVQRIVGTYGARGVHVFGSVARGEADAQSEVDFLVDLVLADRCWTCAASRSCWRRCSAVRWAWHDGTDPRTGPAGGGAGVRNAAERPHDILEVIPA
jgi:hypothetical protein